MTRTCRWSLITLRIDQVVLTKQEELHLVEVAAEQAEEAEQVMGLVILGSYPHCKTQNKTLMT